MYVTIFFFILVFIFTISYKHTRMLRESYFGLIIVSILRQFYTIKKHSKPNSSSKFNIFTKFVFPVLIHIEMKIRRIPKYTYSLIIIATTITMSNRDGNRQIAKVHFEGCSLNKATAVG